MSNDTMQDKVNGVCKAGSGTLAAAENLGRELRTSAQHLGTAIKDASCAMSDSVGTAAQGAYDSLVASGKESACQVESKIQQSPLLAIGIAFGIGMLTSALCYRKA
jgi:ElaB/YqjD/DUF883 family membrane-anchored ribosome-binding protein